MTMPPVLVRIPKKGCVQMSCGIMESNLPFLLWQIQLEYYIIN